MSTLSVSVAVSRRYGLKWWMRALFLILSVIGLCLGANLFALSLTPTAQNPWGLRLLATALVLAGLYIALSAFLYSVQLDSESVSVGGLLRTRTMRLDAIKGYRTISNQYGAYLVLEGSNAADRPLRISSYFNFDDDWTSWTQDLPNLDKRQRNALLYEIARSTELGDSPNARLARLKHAKTVAISLDAVAIVAAAFLWAFQAAIDINLNRALTLLLIVMPWVALWLQFRSPLLYSLVDNKKDPRPSLLLVLLASGLGLLASPFDNVQTTRPGVLILYGCILGLTLGTLLYRTSRRNLTQFASVLVLGTFGCIYGYGVFTQADTQFDTSPIRQYSTQVLDKSYSSGRSTTYHLSLASWDKPGPATRVTVSNTLYRSLHIGDQACIYAHDGSIGVPWYSVNRCK